MWEFPETSSHEDKKWSRTMLGMIMLRIWMILQMLGKREESTKGKWQRWKSHRTRLWEHELKVKNFQGKKGFTFALWMCSSNLTTTNVFGIQLKWWRQQSCAALEASAVHKDSILVIYSLGCEHQKAPSNIYAYRNRSHTSLLFCLCVASITCWLGLTLQSVGSKGSFSDFC